MLETLPLVEWGVAGQALSGQSDYAWLPTGFFAQLTTYKVTVGAFTDVGHHLFKATEWTFTTTIQPRVISVTSAGAVIGDGGEIDPGAPVQLNFNDAMDHSTVTVTAGTKIVDLKWSTDDRSATISTAGVASGQKSPRRTVGAVQ